MVYFFRRWSTDHDKDMVNYKLIKETILDVISQFRIPDKSEIDPSTNRQMLRSETLSDMTSNIKMKLGMRPDKQKNFESFNNKPLKASASVINMDYMKNGPYNELISQRNGQSPEGQKLPKLNRYNVRTLGDSH